MAPNNYAADLAPPTQDSEESTKKKEEKEIAHLPDLPEVKEKPEAFPETKFLWTNIISIALVHALAVYTFFFVAFKCHILSWVWGFATGGVAGFGVTAGAHRLFAHRSYKAKWPLKALLLMSFSMAGQNNLYDWVRDHRVHHKYSETDADPHNASRGFFFSHVGWLLRRKHPKVIEKGRQLDMSDIVNDPMIAFHTKYFTISKVLLCFVIPILVPWYFWDEPLLNCFLGIGCMRYVLGLNFTWLVNSAAHIWGNKPYDRRIGPSENLTVALLAMGEGWHNYHHVFPWDYKAAELGNYMVNITTMFLDLFAKIGWAYDLKTPSKELVEQVSRKYGSQSGGDHHHMPEVDVNGRPVNGVEKCKAS